MPTLAHLDDVVALVERTGHGKDVYVRWSRGPDEDVHARGQSSRDSLTGVPLPGLSANSLSVESWWGDRPLRLWVARRLYDYRHLRHKRGPHVRAWVFVGDQCGRGPDNEPLVRCRRPLAWIGEAALQESDRLVAAQPATDWGPLDRA